MTTIRVSPELSKEIDDKKKLYNFNSKEETIAFALALLKTKEELLKDSLIPLRDQLYSLDQSELYDEIEDKIDELMEDPYLSALKKTLQKRIRAGSTSMKEKEFKNICRGIGIPPGKWDDYAQAFKFKWSY